MDVKQRIRDAMIEAALEWLDANAVSIDKEAFKQALIAAASHASVEGKGDENKGAKNARPAKKIAPASKRGSKPARRR